MVLAPISVEFSDHHRFTFKDGYFFTNGNLKKYQLELSSYNKIFTTEPGFFKEGDFGIRLANVLEVVDTAKSHPSGAKFLALNDITLVPYEPKLIETALLSAQEVSTNLTYE